MTQQLALTRRTFARPSLSATVAHLLDVYRSRQALSRLDADALTDIGLSRQEADTEVARGFWDAPSHWQR